MRDLLHWECSLFCCGHLVCIWISKGGFAFLFGEGKFSLSFNNRMSSPLSSLGASILQFGDEHTTSLFSDVNNKLTSVVLGWEKTKPTGYFLFYCEHTLEQSFPEFCTIRNRTTRNLKWVCSLDTSVSLCFLALKQKTRDWLSLIVLWDLQFFTCF